MTDILCRWLNDEVKLSHHVDGSTFADDFANGYLLGEVLYKHGLQNDFSSFSQSSTSDSKLNNFTRVEPVMALLEIPFDTNLAKDIMSRKPGVATRLLYQLFIALGKKTKMNLTGVAMETMRASGPAKLSNIETSLYKERLKTLVPRQVDLDFDDLIDRYHKQQKEQESKSIMKQMEEEEKLKKYRQQRREEGLERSRQIREKQDEVMKRIKEATVKIPKPPESKKSAKQRFVTKKSKEAADVYDGIDQFENKMKAKLPPMSPLDVDKSDVDTNIDIFVSARTEIEGPVDSMMKVDSNRDYINKIRNRLNQDSQARKEREKRRRRVLMEQMKANEAQEEARREEMLVNRLMRQSQMERRIAVQLMQVRHEKDVIKQNRLLREQQFTERRLKDFDDALEREAEMCRQARLEYEDELAKNKALHEAIAAERAKAKYEKHFIFCKEVLSSVIDFSCKVGEYRELTERLLPAKLVREWKAMFIDAKPFYTKEVRDGVEEDNIHSVDLVDEREKLLDEDDFEEYQNVIGEWENKEIQGGQDKKIVENPILGHLLKRIFDVLYPPPPPPEKPQFPPCPIKACILGKFFCGKTTAVQHITATHRIVSLDAELLLQEAVSAFQEKETLEIAPTDLLDDVVAIPTPSGDPGESQKDLETGNQSDSLTRDVVPSAEPDNTAGQEDMQAAKNPVKDEDASKLDKGKSPDDMKGSTEPESSSTTSVLQPNVVESNQSLKSGPSTAELTKRAKLGGKSFQYLKKGKQVPDNVMVDIIADAIRHVPEGTGWILDGFPTTIAQAKLLEKALTGFEAIPSPTKSVKPDVKKNKKSRLANDPIPPPPTPAPKSGFDVVIQFDMEDELILKRAEGRTYNPDTMEEYHQEFNPPPDGSYTGVCGKTEVQAVIDPTFDREQVQARLTGFQDTWPKLEKWFNKFGVLTKMNVDRPPGDIFLELENVIEETLIKINQMNQPAEEEKPVEPGQQQKEPQEENAGERKTEEATAIEPQPQVETPTSLSGQDGRASKQGGKDSKEEGAKAGKKGAKREGGRSSPGTKKGKEKRDRERSATPTKGKSSPKTERPSSKKGSRSPSPTKGSRPGSKQGSRPGSKSGRRSKSPAKEEPPPVEPDPEPQGPQPGSPEWEYVDMPVDKEVAHFLVPKWEAVECGYIETCKMVFRKIRDEKEKIIRYFFNTRKGFYEFLKRPDTKQEFVEQWQKEYNEIDEDLREDEDVKAELHQRVEDLCVRLWDICDVRKEEAENERYRIMNEGWLEDRTGILVNHYLSLMQQEVDRFQDTCKLVRDYYTAMEQVEGSQKAVILSALNVEYIRLPLVELPPVNIPVKESEHYLPPEPKPLSAKGSREKDRNKETKTPENPDAEDEVKVRIPLVQRRPKSSDQSPGKDRKEKKTTPRKDKVDEKDDSPVSPCDLDERLIYDAQQTAYQIVESQVALFISDEAALAARHAEEKEKELQKTMSKGKKDKKHGGRRSAGKSTSKAQLMETPPPAPPKEEASDAQNEDEKQKKVIKERAQKELKAAIEIEGERLRSRIDLIRSQATMVISDLKSKAEITHNDMDDWLGKRFLEEMDSIDAMAKLMRVAIENQDKIQDSVVLQDKDFLVEIDFCTFKTPSPPPPPPPVETAYSDAFTVVQLQAIYQQLKKTAPSGVISVRAFCDTFQDLAACAEGSETLPDNWMTITPQQLQEVANILSWDQENIDWRSFLVAASQPFPDLSNHQLLALMETFRSFDKDGTGFIDKEDFMQVPLFITESDMDPQEDGIAENITYDRHGNLQLFLFDVFSESYAKQNLLDYKLMLQYLSISSNPLDGFLRALSVVTGRPMAAGDELEVISFEGGDIPVYKDQVTSELLNDILITDLLQTFNLGLHRMVDSHRFSTTKEFLNLLSKDQLDGIYHELGADEGEPVPLYLLYQHPVMKEYINSCQKYKFTDLRGIFKPVDDSFD